MSNRNLDSLVDALYEISAAALCDQFGDERAADRYLCAARDRLATIPTVSDAVWVASLVEVPTA
jgi:hypothetical protein